MITPRQIAQAAFPLLGQWGLSLALWYDSLLSVISDAVSRCWMYKQHKWTWSMRKDAFLTTADNPLRIVTTFPIRTVFWFYSWTMREYDKTQPNPFCDCDVPQDVCKPVAPCICQWKCGKLDIKYIMPHDELCPWTYQISWSDMAWVGWNHGTVVRVYPKTALNWDWLWMSYFISPQQLTDFDQVIPMPVYFLPALAQMVKYLAWPSYLQFRTWEEINAYQDANNLLENLKIDDGKQPDWLSFANNTFNGIMSNG